MTRCALNRRE
uniref:Uncharacterized protein n=1 Tax=Arundo donax TaxID=35708 RepID=A0A0A9B709_ARUDO